MMRNTTFHRTKVNSKGKEVDVGIKDLVTTLKMSVYLDEEEQSKNMNVHERVIFKSFTPTYLSAAEWLSVANPTNKSNSNNV